MEKDIVVMGIKYNVEFTFGEIIAKILNDEVTFPDGYNNVEPADMCFMKTNHPYTIVSFGNTSVNYDYIDSGIIEVVIHEKDNLPLFIKYSDGWRIIAPWIERVNNE